MIPSALFREKSATAPISRVTTDRGFKTFKSTAMSGYKSISQMKCFEPRRLLSRVPTTEMSGGVVSVSTSAGFGARTPRIAAPAKKDAYETIRPILFLEKATPPERTIFAHGGELPSTAP
jgi:hypothetical protein